MRGKAPFQNIVLWLIISYMHLYSINMLVQTACMFIVFSLKVAKLLMRIGVYSLVTVECHIIYTNKWLDFFFFFFPPVMGSRLYKLLLLLFIVFKAKQTVS